jgi:hypothetical protein
MEILRSLAEKGGYRIVHRDSLDYFGECIRSMLLVISPGHFSLGIMPTSGKRRTDEHGPVLIWEFLHLVPGLSRIAIVDQNSENALWRACAEQRKLAAHSSAQ